MPDNAPRQHHEDFSESHRKVVHIGLGLIAFSLKWLPVPVAAAVAFVAILVNAFVLPRIGGRRISRGARGTDLGIIYYPIAVFLLIVLFRDRIAIAAVAWVILAFGDGSATIVGRLVGEPKLPWNHGKSVAGFTAFIVVAVPVAWLLTRSFGASETTLPMLLIVFVTCAVAAIVESLPTGINDNLTVPFSAALTMVAMESIARMPHIELAPDARNWMWANAILALVGFAAKSVNVSGLIGGFALGAIVILFGGWQLYIILLAFFVLGTATTKLGYRRKERAGLAQEGKGRRGFSHAFANVGAATILAFLSITTDWPQMALWLAAVAALATAAADTTASEIGQLIGRRAFLPLTFRRVPVGTEGAISVEGTLAGAVAAMVVSVAGTVMWISYNAADDSVAAAVRVAISPQMLSWSAKCAGLLSLAAILGSYLESVAGSWNRRQAEPVSNGTLNFLNTAAGAALMLIFARWL